MADEQAQQDGQENQSENEDSAVQLKDDGASDAKQQKLVFIVLIVNAVVLLVVAVLFWLNMSKQSNSISLKDIEEQSMSEKHAGEHGEKGGHGEGEKKEAAPEANAVVESFTVNLTGNEGSHYAKVDIAIEVANDFVKDEINKLKPKIRDFIVITLSSKSYEQIMSADGVEFLREEIRNKINGYLTKGEIKDIYFTNFIVQ